MANTSELNELVLSGTDGSTQTIHWERTYRELPDKRVSGRAQGDGQDYFVKIFAVPSRAQKDLANEMRGIEALQSMEIPTAPIRQQAQVFAPEKLVGAAALVSDWIAESPSLAEMLERQRDGEPQDLADAFVRVSALLARMHAQALVHEDPHAGNFLVGKDKVWVVDAASIETTFPSRHHAWNNLAELLAQIPLNQSAIVDHAWKAYVDAAGEPHQELSLDVLKNRILNARRRQGQNLAKKVMRSCTRCDEHHLPSGRHLLMVAKRSQQPLIDAIENLVIDNSQKPQQIPLSVDGDGSWVAQTFSKPSESILARKRRRHPALKSWQFSQVLESFGIAAPQSLGLMFYRGTKGKRMRALWLHGESGEPISHLSAEQESAAKNLESQLESIGIRVPNRREGTFALRGDEVIYNALDQLRFSKSARP